MSEIPTHTQELNQIGLIIEELNQIAQDAKSYFEVLALENVEVQKDHLELK